MSLVYFESCYYSFVELAFREEYNCTGLKQNFRLDRFDLLKAASRKLPNLFNVKEEVLD